MIPVSLAIFLLLFIQGLASQHVENNSHSFRKYTCESRGCGSDAECMKSSDGGLCLCNCGYQGNPYEECNRIDPKIMTRIKVGFQFPSWVKMDVPVSRTQIASELIKNLFYSELLVEDRLRIWGRYIPGSLNILEFKYATK